MLDVCPLSKCNVGMGKRGPISIRTRIIIDDNSCCLRTNHLHDACIIYHVEDMAVGWIQDFNRFRFVCSSLSFHLGNRGNRTCQNISNKFNIQHRTSSHQKKKNYYYCCSSIITDAHLNATKLLLWEGRAQL